MNDMPPLGGRLRTHHIIRNRIIRIIRQILGGSILKTHAHVKIKRTHGLTNVATGIDCDCEILAVGASNFADKVTVPTDPTGLYTPAVDYFVQEYALEKTIILGAQIGAQL